MRFTRSFGWLVFSLGVVFSLSGCLGGKSSTEPEPLPAPILEGEEEEAGAIKRFGDWLGEDMGERRREKKKQKALEEAKKARESPLPKPQRIPVGKVHLVHNTGGFVLIQTSRSAVIPSDAELLTYGQGGRPTGKLVLSRERKGAFLAADVIQGKPQAGDRVLMFYYRDEKGEDHFGTTDPSAVEVLE